MNHRKLLAATLGTAVLMTSGLTVGAVGTGAEADIAKVSVTAGNRVKTNRTHSNRELTDANEILREKLLIRRLANIQRLNEEAAKAAEEAAKAAEEAAAAEKTETAAAPAAVPATTTAETPASIAPEAVAPQATDTGLVEPAAEQTLETVNTVDALDLQTPQEMIDESIPVEPVSTEWVEIGDAAYEPAVENSDAENWTDSSETWTDNSGSEEWSDSSSNEWTDNSGSEEWSDGSNETWTDNSETWTDSSSETWSDDSSETWTDDSSETWTDESYSEESYDDTASGTRATVSGSDLDLLAAIIQCEAGGESYEGKVAVGAVVLNRMDSSLYPSEMSDVIYQPWQFTPAMTGNLQNVLSEGARSDCYEAAQAALNGENPVGDCLYFHAGGGDGLTIGNQTFY